MARTVVKKPKTPHPTTGGMTVLGRIPRQRKSTKKTTTTVKTTRKTPRKSTVRKQTRKSRSPRSRSRSPRRDGRPTTGGMTLPRDSFLVQQYEMYKNM